MNILEKAFAYLRGYISSMRWFTQRTVICQVGKLRVFKGNGVISVGHKTWFWPSVKLASNSPRADRPAQLTIGRDCAIGDRTEIHCGERITIEDNVLISWDCNILDRDYHSTDGSEERTAPVHIGKGAWIGCRAIILKGVTIGEGAIISAGAVVTKDVPPYTLAAGNPAQLKKKVEGHGGS